MTKNWNCQNDKCVDSNGETRKLPAGGDSNMLLCRACFEHEINFRMDRNRSLSHENRFSLPRWEELEIVNPQITPEYWAQPYLVKYTYVKKADNTAWNVGEIADDETVKLWSINAWGQVFYETCLLGDFTDTYRSYEHARQ